MTLEQYWQIAIVFLFENEQKTIIRNKKCLFFLENYYYLSILDNYFCKFSDFDRKNERENVCIDTKGNVVLYFFTQKEILKG